MAPGCPFDPSPGYSTSKGVKDWMMLHKTTRKPPESLEADLDPNAPLYFWQLYSILGPERIEKMMHDFYTRIYEDTSAPWFTTVFKEREKSHHVRVNSQFWMDAFGGGKKFYGGEDRVNYFHTANAKELMTARGAARWMHHMRGALFAQQFERVDPRITPAILEFLKISMAKYARKYGWNLASSDFRMPSKMCAIA
mmetsp:Transcript_33841/g.60462  ORF Transcript_33841/g.60462 Transcript_33841/m.60462 type:complete len:196 (-) Transcript_33841:111-698(-)|eukprot:CAMPEP_0177763430 /NCGR_PEP_ID=MMETSP0491_2-20121128/6868_1 /TAXON_ID=63592 /ORGANISM="Tetraselmis chuii, Strain PLY429" /LENGTH=195 /DNA_ID=CAMNT_0019279539 /DNA_START=239 /DNA_END=826 /DNA_ORIENTATION=+